MDTTVLKCPGCGSPLPYDASIGKWKCEACGSVYDAIQVMQMAQDSDKDTDTQKMPKPWISISSSSVMTAPRKSMRMPPQKASRRAPWNTSP
ncbi:MAG: hypothetical protein IKM98_06660, partial [Bacteroidales bacterium]|nr:hypothetical protein [Bacteroidales bacterium]